MNKGMLVIKHNNYVNGRHYTYVYTVYTKVHLVKQERMSTGYAAGWYSTATSVRRNNYN